MYAQTVASKQHRATYKASSTKKGGVYLISFLDKIRVRTKM